MFRTIKRTFLLGVGAAVGAAVAHFADPDLGRSRRARAKDQVLSMARGEVDQLRKEAIQVADRTKGTIAEAASRPGTDLNTPALKQKIESEVLGDPRFPKGSINVLAENGRILLKGTVDRPEQIVEIESRVRNIPGVHDVENQLHTASP